MSSTPEQPEPQSRDAEQAGLLWPPAHIFPEEVDVIVVFHGLFLFAHNASTGFCEVGVHDRTPDHTFRVGAWEVEPDGEIRQLCLGATPDRSVILGVDDPSNHGARFLQPQMGINHELSWSKVPDLEGPLFYNECLDKIPNSLKPIIKIKHGVFFTLLETEEHFYREAEDDSRDAADLGSVAFLIGAILSHHGGPVVLNIDGRPYPLNAEGGKKHVLYFSNACPQDRERCDFDPESDHKEERNDFYLYFHAVRKPKGKREYVLRLKKRDGGGDTSAKASARPAISSLSFLDLDVLEKHAPFSTHKAPCGGSGYGRTDEGFGDV